MKTDEILLSGKASFNLEVPYRLFHSQQTEKEPLFVYLHENGLNLTELEKITQPLRHLSGYHLLIQAPYPDINTDKKPGKFYWIPKYQDEQTITATREHVSEFLQEVIDNLIPHINVSRLVLVGWEGSRGQVSYFCGTRPHYINELVLFSGSVDRSWMEQDSNRYRHLRVLGLSGKDAIISDDVAETIREWIGGG